MLFGKPEISNNCSSLVEKDVGKFEISVKEPAFCDFNVSTNYIFGQLDGFFFEQFAFPFQKNTEISFVTIFGDDETVSRFSDYIKTL